MIERHDLELEERFATWSVTAVCSCGWAREEPNRARALEAWEAHSEAAFGWREGGGCR